MRKGGDPAGLLYALEFPPGATVHRGRHNRALTRPDIDRRLPWCLIRSPSRTIRRAKCGRPARLRPVLPLPRCGYRRPSTAALPASRRFRSRRAACIASSQSTNSAVGRLSGRNIPADGPSSGRGPEVSCSVRCRRQAADQPPPRAVWRIHSPRACHGRLWRAQPARSPSPQ